MTQIQVSDPSNFAQSNVKPNVPPPPKRKQPRRDLGLTWSTALTLVAIVALADFLFWAHSPGISLVVFSAALTLAALGNIRPDFSPRTWKLYCGFWLVFAAPTIEFVQATAVLFLIAGHFGLLIWAALKTQVWREILRNLVSLIILIPIVSVLSSVATWQAFKSKDRIGIQPAALMVTALPLVFGALFVFLFVGANPIFENWINSALKLNPDLGDPSRVIFWGVFAFFTLPIVLFAPLSKLLRTPHPKHGPARPLIPGVITAQSIILSLALFNLMFAMQNLTDLVVLWGEATLPDGMTYAQYAHRGAYPLMATSILAAIFVLISRRFTETSPVLKTLLLIWIAQNILLVGSALTRLDLYIEAYGLTYLRIRAGIGMGLVIVGMGLLAWQIWARRTNAWVTSMFAACFVGVIYIASFVNFANVITTENLARDTGTIDAYYLCRMAPLNARALSNHIKAGGDDYCSYRIKYLPTRPKGWRDWSWRTARVGANLAEYKLLTWGRPVTRPLSTSTTDWESELR